MARGRLRIYLGAAPGVGKTYAMLSDGHQRVQRGVDCVIGFVEPHGRPATEALTAGLETVACREVVYRGEVLSEMDLAAVLARRPQVALVDELAHTNAPGSRHGKRWEDVEELLEAGIDVVTTVNVQHLESLGDVMPAMTGVRQRETVPDAVVREADELELVDLSPDALRRRLVAGEIYPPDRIDAALSHYFRASNLTGLRELALLWLADRVEEGLRRYRSERNVTAGWETRERIVVAVSGGPESDALIRRAARLAGRTPGSDLMGVYVARSDGRPGADATALSALRGLVEALGGSWHQVVGMDVAQSLGRFARHENATQLMVGASHGTGWWGALGGRLALAGRVARLGPGMDVHVVTDETRAARLPMRLPRARGVGARRRGLAAVLMLVALPLLTVVLTQLRARLSLSDDLLLYLLLMVVTAVIGGLYPALLAAVVSVALADYYLTRPYYALRVAAASDVVALVVYVATAVLVSVTVEASARRRRVAIRTSAEAAVVTSIATAVLRGEGELPRLLELVRETFGLQAVSLLERPSGAPPVRGSWLVAASAGAGVPEDPDQSNVQAVLGPSTLLVGRGPALAAPDLEAFTACAAQIAETVRGQRLSAHTASAEQAADSEHRRAGLAVAAGRALTGPVDMARAALTTLRADRCSDPGQLKRVEGAIDRVAVVAGQLDDLARASTGALDIRMRQVELAEVIAAALDELGPGHAPIRVATPHDLPAVVTDPTVLSRVVTALAVNAVRRTTPETSPAIEAAAVGDRVRVRVESGPMHPGDGDFTVAVARDLVEAVDGALWVDGDPDARTAVVVELISAAGRH